MTERELSLTIYKALIDLGLTRRPPPITLSSGKPPAGGKASDKKIEKGDLIHIDFGGKYDFYAADFTRMAVLKGEPPKEFEKAYNLLVDVEQTAVKAVRPGIKAAEIDAIAREKLAEHGYTYKHNTGHGLGLHTHYYPVIGPKETRTLKAGMCFTIEPTIRVPGKIFAHVEDDVVVTKNGYESFTTFPREIYRID
jgi:Xaa-Pro aminopeptidase